jgi:hypothetical protein
VNPLNVRAFSVFERINTRQQNTFSFDWETLFSSFFGLIDSTCGDFPHITKERLMHACCALWEKGLLHLTKELPKFEIIISEIKERLRCLQE